MPTSMGWGTISFTTRSSAQNCQIDFLESRNQSRVVSHRRCTTLSICSTTRGNSDRQDENGDTVDWLSIYRHGHDGEPEGPWKYVFLSFFRDDVGAIRKELRKRGNDDVFWGNLELAAFATALFVMFLFNWRYVIFYFLPFWYLGHCFSYLNGYYRHYGANPDKPIAWGVSSYGKIYNWLFFYNGYHAEHHFRPKVHWTKMEKFRRKIVDLQKQEGVRTIKRAHMLGFLDPDLPKRGKGKRDVVEVGAA